MIEKILIVDDSVEIRSKFYEIFFSLGYTVTCVPTGKEALFAFTERRYDMIILEERLPDMQGEDIVYKIREFDKEAKIIVVCEGEVEGEGKGALKRNDVQAIIKKDFSSHLMVKKILEILRQEKPHDFKEPVCEKLPQLVLVVDDNEEIRRMLEIFLEKRGYNVQSASSGEDAIMKVKMERPRLVLMDVRMPGMDGIMALQQIKRLDESIKVVMLTSAQEEYIIKEAEKWGACDYLIKPCDLNKLDTLIMSILSQK